MAHSPTPTRQSWSRRRNHFLVGLFLIVAGAVGLARALRLYADGTAATPWFWLVPFAVPVVFGAVLLVKGLRCPSCRRHTSHVLDRHGSRCGAQLRP